MKLFTIILGSVAFICALIYSYANCVYLFQSTGSYTGWAAYVASLMVGIVAIQGAIIIISNRMKSISPGIFSWVAVVMGIAYATWGNVSRGWDYGVTGIFVAIGISSSLVITAVILAGQITQVLTKQPSENNDRPKGSRA
ncbi:hypothetical protein GCM10011571_35510 [Marinithermofilum abyssi]|uniref:Uncharacterized protein n=1 Tax=Marinithermofilum abyssi TaxID=1571185 RepID=A0A8J2VHQ1_9BACL|nr:hypothetical protein [Marinithermofilum abyssi]GGE30200.1 hypothetical protein GCM10011571_35510 [Marinithermofilum abyssi]